MTDKIVVLTTCDSEELATRLARHLVDRRLAACVNILPGARSVYRWNDKIEESTEVLLMIKSRRELFPALRGEIEKIHTYEIPEIIAMSVVDGSEAYLSWIEKELAS